MWTADNLSLYLLVRIEEFLVLIKGKPVRHGSNIITDDFVFFNSIVLPVSLINGIGKLCRTVFIDIKKVVDDPFGLIGHAHHAVMMIEFFIQQILKMIPLRLHQRAEINNRGLGIFEGIGLDLARGDRKS